MTHKFTCTPPKSEIPRKNMTYKTIFEQSELKKFIDNSHILDEKVTIIVDPLVKQITENGFTEINDNSLSFLSGETKK